jgi:alpha-N-arabinofuranosidase
MKENYSALFALVATLSLLASAAAQTPPPAAPSTVVLQIDAAKIAAHVSPALYGLMTEEINYSYDGGLYAELVRNRTFQDDANEPVHWAVVQDGGGAGTIALDRTQPLNDALPVALKLDVNAAANGASPMIGRTRVGVANDGFWGIPVWPGTRYRVSFYAKADKNFSGSLTVAIEGNDGALIHASAEVPRISQSWHKYEVTLTTSRDAPVSATNRLVVSTADKGTVWFNLVSLFPPTWHGRPNGNRLDIMQLLADMKPAFLRFPGGNYLQGRTLATRFPWKKTLGDLAERPGHLDDSWNYRSSDGMGLLEYLEWCEDLNMQPVLAVFAGFNLRGVAAKPGPELDPFVQEALEEIEYVTGDATTTWGARRVKDGHPAPFKLEYVEIGNEDNFDRVPGSYDGRFTAFFDAIKAKYPALKVIATIPVKSRVPDVVDEHFYRSAKQFQADTHRYDSYDRQGPKVFVGEWATREGVPTPNLGAALGDAAWMTGMERNSDLVIMSCYAPLFVNVNPGGMQWRTDLIGYDALTSYGSPAYYAQKMFSLHHGDVVLSATAEGVSTEEWQPPAPRGGQPRPAQPPPPTAGTPPAQAAPPPPAAETPPPPLPPKQHLPTFFYNVTRDSKAGTIYLKLVNMVGTPLPVRVELKGVAAVAPEGEAITLSGSATTDTNSITEPVKIVPVESKATGLAPTFTRELAPYSITILQLHPR